MFVGCFLNFDIVNYSPVNYCDKAPILAVNLCCQNITSKKAALEYNCLTLSEQDIFCYCYRIIKIPLHLSDKSTHPVSYPRYFLLLL